MTVKFIHEKYHFSLYQDRNTMPSIAKFLKQVVLIAASTVTAVNTWAAVPIKPTGTSPGTPIAPGPIQGSASITLSWSAVATATHYGLSVVDNATGGFVVKTNVAGATTYKVALQSGKTYRWNVNACNSSGCSKYTTVFYFQTPAPHKTYSSLAVTCTPNSVNEGGTSTCKAAANFSDGSQLDVTSAAGLKLSTTAYASINKTSGVVTTKTVPSDQTVMVSGSYSDKSGTAKFGSTTLAIKNVLPVAYPRMSLNTKHASIHVYTYGKSAAEISTIAKNIKASLGDASGRTSFEGRGERAQLAIQTEITLRRFINDGVEKVFADLSKTVDTFWAEGFAVHLLIGVHNFYKISDNNPNESMHWQGLDLNIPLSQKTRWKEWGDFVPFQPCKTRLQGTKICEYDVIFENFHRPLIAKIATSKLADKLSVIYVMNEFDYATNLAPAPANWGKTVCGSQSDWRRCRAEALAYTAKRGFDIAHAASSGKIPIGFKFQKFEPTSGWNPVSGSDQLSYLLIDVMGDKDGVIGYDCYWTNSQADDKCPDDKKRIFDVLTAGGKFDSYKNGRIEVSEYGAVCVGAPKDIISTPYRRTDELDIISLTRDWDAATGFNLFAFNSNSDAKGHGCFAVADPTTNIFFKSTKSELKGLRTQIKLWTGQ